MILLFFTNIPVYILKCRRRDSNPQGITHMNLNHARLPISPLRHFVTLYTLVNYTLKSLWRKCTSLRSVPSRKTILNRFSRQSATSTLCYTLYTCQLYTKIVVAKMYFTFLFNFDIRFTKLRFDSPAPSKNLPPATF